MRFATIASALIALSVNAIAQDAQNWADAPSPAAVSAPTQLTTTITKTLEIVHTETVYNIPFNNSTVSVVSQTASIVAEPTPEESTPEETLPEETTSAGAAPIATPTGISGADVMSRDLVFAVMAAGAVALLSY